MNLDDVLRSPKVIEIPIINNPPGVYFLISKGEIVYVGQSKNPVSRIDSHRSNWTTNGSKEFDRAILLPVPDHHPISDIEKNFIVAIKPKLNCQSHTKGKIYRNPLGWLFPEVIEMEDLNTDWSKK